MLSTLKELRKEKGLKQSEVANYLGVSTQAYSSYETGAREPGLDIVLKLADLFGVSTDTILGRPETEAAPEPGWKVIDPADFPPQVVARQPLPDLEQETALIPILGSVRAGYDNFAEENHEGDFAVDPRLKSMHPEAFVLTVRGDSMEPEIHHGDLVICLPDAEIRSNDVAIVCVNGEIGTVKRVRFDRTGLTLIPANPRYKQLHYSPEDVESLPVTLQARVVETRHRYA